MVPLAEGQEAVAVGLLQAIRQQGSRAEMAYRGNLKRRMERANRIGARIAVIIGDDEVARQVAQVKDLITGQQQEVPLLDVPCRLLEPSPGRPVYEPGIAGAAEVDATA